LSYEALSDGLSADQLIEQILRAVPVPDKPLESHVRVS
jgi:MoxR-like ATPase